MPSPVELLRRARCSRSSLSLAYELSFLIAAVYHARYQVFRPSRRNDVTTTRTPVTTPVPSISRHVGNARKLVQERVFDLRAREQEAERCSAWSLNWIIRDSNSLFNPPSPPRFLTIVININIVKCSYAIERLLLPIIYSRSLTRASELIAKNYLLNY